MIRFGIDRKGSVERDRYDDGGWFIDFRIWIDRPKWWGRVPRSIIRAAPTCTLYRQEWDRDVLVFRYWPYFTITGLQLLEAQA